MTNDPLRTKHGLSFPVTVTDTGEPMKRTIALPLLTGIEDESQKLRITPSRADAGTNLFLSTTVAGQFLLLYVNKQNTVAVSVDDLVEAMQHPYRGDLAAETRRLRSALKMIAIGEFTVDEQADMARAALIGEQHEG